MRKVALVVLALAALAAPAAATAAERQIAKGEAYDISTYRGWLMWTGADSHPVLWRGSPRSFDPPGTGASGALGARLGSDARGRTTVVYQRCQARDSQLPWRYRDCELVRRLLATGAERTLLVANDSFAIGPSALDMGTLAITYGVYDSAGSRSLQLFQPGIGQRRLSGDHPHSIDIDRGRLAYVAFREVTSDRGDFSVARAVDLRSRRPRYRTLATHDGTEEDGRVPGTTLSRFESAATDGRYAYWLRSNLRDSYTDSTFEVWRADLDEAGATLRKTRLAQPAWSIAVGSGRIYYTGREEGGVYAVTNPVWSDAE